MSRSEPGREPGADPVLDELIAGNDLDELVREVDRRTDARDWDGLDRLRRRCRAALDRGLQLWPAATLAEYRLALRAPGAWAAVTAAEGSGRFALGPLPEVAASTHTWAELAPHLAAGPAAGVCAHERVVRGETLTEAGVPFADVFGVPLALEPWEPEWPVATYGDNEVHAPRPRLPALAGRRLPAPGRPVDDTGAEVVLGAVVEPWVSQSNGRVEVACVEGGALAAVAALGVERARVAEVERGGALAQIAWAAASGGAHGRRRGAAAGRDLAWATVEALGDGRAAGRLRWFVWSPGEGDEEVGWNLHLAMEDPDRGRAWALAAEDRL